MILRWTLNILKKLKNNDDDIKRKNWGSADVSDESWLQTMDYLWEKQSSEDLHRQKKSIVAYRTSVLAIALKDNLPKSNPRKYVLRQSRYV